MAYSNTDTGSDDLAKGQEQLTFHADGTGKIELPSTDFVADAAMTRDGSDLILTTPSGEVAVIEGYFDADPAPLLQSPDGSALTPNLVQAFAKSPMEFAANETSSDQSPVGAVEEVKGNCTVTRADGSVENITIGTPIYQGDIIETDASGAVNIVFMDETSMAVSENARLAIDEYTFDPSTESGTTNFSVLRGLFVFTSGLIGRDDPDDVTIDTPVGSIGIRGTVIAGDINPGGESKITVLEGAIVVKNGLMDVTLSEQFETVRINSFEQQMENIGTVPANDISSRFNSIGDVSPALFTTINDAAGEQSKQQNQPAPEQKLQNSTDAAPEPQSQLKTSNDADIISLKDTKGLDVAHSPAPAHTSNTHAAEFSAPATTHTTSSTNPSAPNFSAETLPPQQPQAPGTIGQPNVPGTTVPGTTNFAVTMAAATIADIAGADTLIGRPTTTGIGVTYTLSQTNNYFQLSSDGSGPLVKLTAAGAAALAGSLDVTQLGGFNLVATDANGTVVTTTVGVTVNDANSIVINMNAPSSSNGVMVITDNLNNKIGHSITALGDINHDGFDDFAFTNNALGVGTNHIYRVSGSAGYGAGGNLSNTTTISMATVTLNNSETVIAGVGDFNGDGTNDYLIGQQNNIINSVGSGTASIVNGTITSSTAILTNTIDVSGNVSTTGWKIGADVDGIGDYNNDGYADVIIGMPGMGSSDGGAIFLKGNSAGWTADILNAQSGGSGNWIRMLGNGGQGFGSSVSGLGDINGDGYSDFGIGAPTDNTFATHGGAVYLYHGQKAGNPVSGSHLIAGSTDNQLLGQEVSGLGDINGDGLSDILVGGEGNVAQIHFGKSDGLATPYAVPEITLNISESKYILTGGSGVGDFNGDGYDDFVITLADANSAVKDVRSYVIFGKDFGSSTTIDIGYLKNPENALEIRYTGADRDDDLEVAGIGDINGDGYDDFAIGLPDANGASAGNGGVAVVYGRNANISTDITATANGQSIVGTSSVDNLSDGGMSGVSLRGGAGNDVFRLHNTNFLGIDGGTQGTTGVPGYDTISMQNSLDFSNINYESISGIEAIQYGSANQTLTLTLENIFNLLKSSDTGDFKIASSMAGSILNIDASPAVSGTDVDPLHVREALNEHGNGAYLGNNTGGYQEFVIGGYSLYIADTVTVNVV